MIVFLDEQLEGLRMFLDSLEWEVTSVIKEKMGGAKDPEVVKYAKEKGYVFVTRDEKASQLAELHKVPCVFLSFAKLAEITHMELLEIEQSLIVE
jgi:predicted nuclease of predicted toxin-antitoxin system